MSEWSLLIDKSLTGWLNHRHQAEVINQPVGALSSTMSAQTYIILFITWIPTIQLTWLRQMGAAERGFPPPLLYHLGPLQPSRHRPDRRLKAAEPISGSQRRDCVWRYKEVSIKSTLFVVISSWWPPLLARTRLANYSSFIEAECVPQPSNRTTIPY